MVVEVQDRVGTFLQVVQVLILLTVFPHLDRDTWLDNFFKSKSLEGSGLRRGYCYTPCRSDTDGQQPTRLCSNSISPSSATLRTPRTALHNLSRDTGDPLTSLSFLLYLLIFPMPRSDYLPHVLLMFLLIYFRSSSGSSINSSTIVSSTQMKNLVVFQFHLHANLLLFPLWLHQQLPELPFIRLGLLLSPDHICIGTHR